MKGLQYNYKELINLDVQLTTKEKILNQSINLFADKGYTETSIREIARAVGIKESSIYNHYNSKIKILEEIFAEYRLYIASRRRIIRDNCLEKGYINATDLEDILFFAFEPDKSDRYIKMLRIIFQEQYRYQEAREYMVEQMIKNTEKNMKAVFDDLVEKQYLDSFDTSVFARLMLSIKITFALENTHGMSDQSPDYQGRTMVEVGRYLIDHILEKYGRTKAEVEKVRAGKLV